MGGREPFLRVLFRYNNRMPDLTFYSDTGAAA